MPDFGREFQDALKRDFAQANIPAFAELDVYGGDASSLFDFRSMARKAGLDAEWADFRARALTEAMLSWMTEHGIDQRRFVRLALVRRSSPGAPVLRHGEGAIQSGIDRRSLLAAMTDEELRTISIPLDTVVSVVRRLSGG